MSSLEEIRDERIKKIELLRENGMEAYPAESNRTLSISDFLKDFDAEGGRSEWLAGRVMALRSFGGIVFAELFDGTGRVQAVLKDDEMESSALALFSQAVDLGDYIEVSGGDFLTKRGEQSVLVKEWRMLAKSLRPLPEKWHGLQDEEARLRQRYLDLLLDDELREVFKKKALFWSVMRKFLEERGFLEVQTPTLEVTTGGAEARPFVTHHNDFDIDVYLRISVGELWQKRLMGAGFPRTFEIGRVYRNEGSSPEHLQEFTNMEFYAAYLNFEEGKKMVQELYRTLASEVFGTTTFEVRGHSFDLSREWQEVDYVSHVEKETGINVLEASEEDMRAKLQELGVTFEGENRERMADSLWKHCRKQIAGPAFLVNHPSLVAPLSKKHPEDERITKTFQVILAGSEVGRAHAELNDPLDQRERFNNQQSLLEGGDEEAMMPDWEYVEAMEHGIPPTFGFGMGERLFSFLVGETIRECQLFPLVKPKK